ncbi:hypothetical protein [Bacillus salipaludis]|uniref:Lipoprotein n=1 Tax=Bacillus salipaludis TaxID=2547811 RepID=A0AA90R7P8_9BACI|nr:hypothetical protein [Bacillus salipaludis]MDQ6597723.1 hypothetical protein [Bacillus salipaludis]
MKQSKKFILGFLLAVSFVGISACSISSGGDNSNNYNTQSSTTDDPTENKEGTSNKGTSSSTNKSDKAVNRPTGAWVDSFEKELYDGYHVTPSRYKNIGNGYWEVWVKEVDTGDNPYVTVNQNTGDFHG